MSVCIWQVLIQVGVSICVWHWQVPGVVQLSVSVGWIHVPAFNCQWQCWQVSIKVCLWTTHGIDLGDSIAGNIYTLTGVFMSDTDSCFDIQTGVSNHTGVSLHWQSLVKCINKDRGQSSWVGWMSIVTRTSISVTLLLQPSCHYDHHRNDPND